MKALKSHMIFSFININFFMTRFVFLVVMLFPFTAFGQSSCGFNEPKVTFSDGSNACLSEFPFFSRKGLLQSFPDHIQLAKRYKDYAIAIPANPDRCPFVRFTAWDTPTASQNALPRCQERMDAELVKNTTYKDCRCDVLIDSGKTKLNRMEFAGRLSSVEYFLTTNNTVEQARKAEEERQAKAKREAEEERQAKAKREDEERKKNEIKIAIPGPSNENRPVAGPSIYTDRVALVVGNKNYITRPLENPINDARAMRSRLTALGFKVIYFENLKVNEIGDVMEKVANAIRPGSVFVFFYAGHGTQIDGENMFPAVDAKLTSAFQLPTQSLDLNRVIRIAESQKATIRIMILDACRDNPWQVVTQSKRSIGSGLAKVDPAEGTIVLHATRAGGVAADTSEGNNGLFTHHLLRHLDTQKLPIEQLFKRVSSDVKQASKGTQVPWTEGQIEGEFTFRER
jgi:hypothetical protein